MSAHIRSGEEPALFLPDGDRFIPTVLTQGPWRHDLQFGGAAPPPSMRAEPGCHVYRNRDVPSIGRAVEWMCLAGTGWTSRAGIGHAQVSISDTAGVAATATLSRLVDVA